MQNTKICDKHGCKKTEDKRSIGFRCKECRKEYSKKYNQDPINKKRKKEYYKQYNQDPEQKEHKQEYDRKYHRDPANKKRRNLRNKNKRKNDPFFVIRSYISAMINRAIKKNGSTKNNYSCLKFLPYTIQELKEHLEKLFDPWMNWNNRGKFSKIWDDNDPATWKWQLDHIIPQSELPYKTMKDENFKKCWALENLRPYSAKQNLIDGATGIRHKNAKL
jgi:hypothetical protein